MKKAFDQTVRDLKRGVNKNVLKVPSIEQKVLDATSNEPWGPHGTLLADIAQASRNYHEYQMIMSIIWKRINDTGKNWRHVYKALTVLEYLVAHGSERVIEEIRERAYQIQTLSDFQYIDSSGRDQGNNVRKKSQNLVVLVNDKERIDEVRQKAAANRDKFQNSSAGSMYRPGSHSISGGYGERYDDRYGGRDEERNGYGRESEYKYRDDDRYGDSYSRNGDRYSRDSEDRYGRDDDYRRRSPSVDGSRSRSSDIDRDRVSEDNGQYSSRGSEARTDDQTQDRSASVRKINRSYSEQNLSAPPSYEDAVGSARSPTHNDRDGETSSTAPKYSPPPASNSPVVSAQATGTAAPTPSSSASPVMNDKEADGFDEFDPRVTFPAVPTTSSDAPPAMSVNGKMDLFDSFADNSLALVPTTSFSSTTEVDTSINSSSGVATQGFNDPFGDGPFKAIPSANGAPGRQQSFHSVPSSSQNASNCGPELPQQGSQNSAVAMFPGASATSSGDTNIDILADILPLSGHQHPVNSQPEYPTTVNQAIPQSMPHSGQIEHQTSFPVQSAYSASINGFPDQYGQLVMHPNFSSQFGQPAPQPGIPVHNGQPSSLGGYPNQSAQASLAGFSAGQPASAGFTSPVNTLIHSGIQSQPSGQSFQPNVVPYGNYNMQSALPQPFQAPQVGSSAAMAYQSSFPSTASISTAPANDKFETKSTVWTDTLSRGLVNLNISGAKTNPLSDIGVDFDALNRKEKRMEKPAATPVTSTIHMGKAMGSGSGIGRAGILRPTSNPMMGAGAGMTGPRPGVGMAGYGGMNQQPMGFGMGMNMAPNMGMGMQQPMGFPPGSTMPGGYNPMMGTGNYAHNPYVGGYR